MATTTKRGVKRKATARKCRWVMQSGTFPRAYLWTTAATYTKEQLRGFKATPVRPAKRGEIL